MNDFDDLRIGARLKRFRETLGISQVEMAKNINISTGRWNNWERGERRISLNYARVLHTKYGLSLDFIYLGRLDALSQKLIKALSDISVESQSSTDSDNPDS